MVDVVEQLATDTAGGFAEEITIDGDELRDVGHRVLGEAGVVGGVAAGADPRSWEQIK